MLSPETAPEPELVPESADTCAARTGVVVAATFERTQAREMRVTTPIYGWIFIDDLWQMAQ